MIPRTYFYQRRYGKPIIVNITERWHNILLHEYEWCGKAFYEDGTPRPTDFTLSVKQFNRLLKEGLIKPYQPAQ